MAFLRGYGAFLDYKYWINPFPVALGPSLAQGILVFFGFFIVAAVALMAFAHTLRKKDALLTGLLRRFAWPVLATGVFGLFALFFAYEQSPFLGMRFWFLLTFIYFFVRLGFIAAYMVREYPQERSEIAERERITQYLPHKK
ncbi:MAG: hypothetical protein RLZZ324_492 [Candidatus Parcubacteria bacterium]|jgi:phosphoglycerol transferase MdoB-like AlkP superfamily enzyme